MKTFYSLDYLYNQLNNPLIPIPQKDHEKSLKLLKILDQEQINIQKLKSKSKKGIPNTIKGLRPLIWKILLNYLPKQRQKWVQTLQNSQQSYIQFLQDFLKKINKPEENKNITDHHPLNTQENNIWTQYFQDHEIFSQIEKDTERTRQEIEFFTKLTMRDDNIYQIPFQTQIRLEKIKKQQTLEERHCDVLSRILFIYAKLNNAVLYVQGMNEILAPLYYVMQAEREFDLNFLHLYIQDELFQTECGAFYIFTHLMSFIKDRFIRELDDYQQGIRSKCFEFRSFLHKNDSQLAAHFDKMDVDPHFYALRWILLLFTQEFSIDKVIQLWDCLFSQDNMIKYIYYIGLAILKIKRKQLMSNDFAVIMVCLQQISHLNINQIIQEANFIQNQFQ
ncbi:TBC1 domain protein [Ichthyophthirius multifiliis]|uniref:TBC1 domain protein n=1 Tax=Ichthyophthirius multifiliis TaxID=5932 RepID=G0QQG9_ICHMU|nr:TBC1 domain protein [Ichthyophthirius multifiliis]EGR32537.1 TBC1 domain protein [Ichthyophthirius multifiliis]|eukprot:XP_004036523.1 TBC1 domain protein [Ichthyophthirius multifiliis]